MNRFTRNKAILQLGEDRFEYIRDRANDGENLNFVLPENSIDEGENSVEKSVENSVEHSEGDTSNASVGIQNGKHALHHVFVIYTHNCVLWMKISKIQHKLIRIFLFSSKMLAQMLC